MQKDNMIRVVCYTKNYAARITIILWKDSFKLFYLVFAQEIRFYFKIRILKYTNKNLKIICFLIWMALFRAWEWATTLGAASLEPRTRFCSNRTDAWRPKTSTFCHCSWKTRGSQAVAIFSELCPSRDQNRRSQCSTRRQMFSREYCQGGSWDSKSTCWGPVSRATSRTNCTHWTLQR